MSNKTRRIVIEAFAIALAFWIGMFERYINFGGFQVGLCMVPILIIHDLYGLKYSAECLLCYNLIKTVFFSKMGILGFMVRLPLIFYLIFRKRNDENVIKKITFDLIGILIYLIIKLPIAYMFWKINSNLEGVNLFSLIFTCIIPCNLASISSIVLISRLINLRKFKFVRSYLEV